MPAPRSTNPRPTPPDQSPRLICTTLIATIGVSPCSGWGSAYGLPAGPAVRMLRRAVMSSFPSPYGSTCCQKSGVRPTSVFGGEHVGPGVFGEHVLEHECVYVDESGLKDPQAERGHFLFVLAVGSDLRS